MGKMERIGKNGGGGKRGVKKWGEKEEKGGKWDNEENGGKWGTEGGKWGEVGERENKWGKEGGG